VGYFEIVRWFAEMSGRGSRQWLGGLSGCRAIDLTPLRDTEGPVGEIVTAVLDYRHHDTAITTFLEPYQSLVTHGDGRVRPTIYTLGTDTGRMSCVRPNLQQLPRTGGIRACLTADPGHVLISADFSSVELRVAAALSGDPNLRKMIVDGVDIHWTIARQVFGAHATKADRYAIKRGVFGRLYGGGVPTLARQVGCSEPVTARMVATPDAMTPTLAAWSARLQEKVKAGQTQFTTYSGATVHLPVTTRTKPPTTPFNEQPGNS
jgi:DNA polymerase I-like protein with 3'-5' exonuclease and polymerase domains